MKYFEETHVDLSQNGSSRPTWLIHASQAVFGSMLLLLAGSQAVQALTDEELRRVRDGFADRRDSYLREYHDAPFFELDKGILECRKKLLEANWIWHPGEDAVRAAPLGVRNFLTDRPFMQPQYRDGRDYVEICRELYSSGQLNDVQAFMWSHNRVSEESLRGVLKRWSKEAVNPEDDKARDRTFYRSMAPAEIAADKHVLASSNTSDRLLCARS